MEKKLRFIVGPTASGKTEFALREATRLGAAILSCDSLCVYRGMDIGTAKPTPVEQAVVPHYGIDLVEPCLAYSVSRYIGYRNQVLNRLLRAGQPVVVVGGSGFYLKSYFKPVTDELDIPEAVTQRVEHIRREVGEHGLIEVLKSCNPADETFEGLDLNNPRRVEKSLIRCLSSGKSYAELRQEFRSLPVPLSDYEKEVVLISRPVEEMRARNRARVGKMLEAGLVDEVRRLRQVGFEKNASACGAIGYREVLEYLDGKVGQSELEELIIIHTNQLMRKQRTWLRHQIPIHREISNC